MAFAPQWALNRIRARALAETFERHFEAASGSRRTAGWPRSGADANGANAPALSVLRQHARDAMRNDGWAKRGRQVIANNTVGWGLMAKPIAPPDAQNFDPTVAAKLWKSWAGTTECDADSQRTFYGLQRAIIETIVESGEVLVRRRRRYPSDGLTIPLQLQILEPDFIDTNKDGVKSAAGGPTIQGIEFDQVGRRIAYWLFEEHPGASRMRGTFASKRVPASEVLHVYRIDRPGQVRGVSWLAAAIVKLKDFDEYDDATLMRQKIAACFAAFVSDVDGAASPIGATDTSDELAETLEPGLISYLSPGKTVTFASPPAITGDNFDQRMLRKIAAAIGVTYEDLSGDYSNVNFSSARMARLAHWACVHDWRWNMLVPQFCDAAWYWAMEAAFIAGLIPAEPSAEWTPPPMPMIEPDKEGLSYMRLVRAGAMTPSEMVREQGSDPETHWEEYAADLKQLDKLGIVIDSDARKVSQAGLVQPDPNAPAPAPPPATAKARADEAEATRLLADATRLLVEQAQ